jgi:NADPH:quinone reductase-like Zn-dependent oxidoreductase
MAGTVVKIGPEVEGFSVGDQVFSTITGNQLLSATGMKAAQTVLVAGTVGNVGRSAVFTAKERGATVIAGGLEDAGR